MFCKAWLGLMGSLEQKIKVMGRPANNNRPRQAQLFCERWPHHHVNSVLLNRMRFTVNKVVHHYDVIVLVVGRTGSYVAGDDPHAGDPRIGKFDC